MRETFLTNNSTQINNNLFNSKPNKDLLILKSINLVFDVIDNVSKSYDEDSLLSSAMDALVDFVNNGVYTKDDFEDKARTYLQNKISEIIISE